MKKSTISTTYDNFIRRTYMLLAYSDTTPTKFFLSVSSALWCLALLLPGETMANGLYRSMAVLVGESADTKWAAIWGGLSLLMLWRVFSSTPAPRVSLAINTLCVGVYSCAVYSILTSKFVTFPVATVSDLACLMASLWVLIRTHVNPGCEWKID